MAGKGTPATALLAREKVAHALHPYEPDASSTSYGEAGAAALGVEPARMLKTLLADLDGKLVCAVVPRSAARSTSRRWRPRWVARRRRWRSPLRLTGAVVADVARLPRPEER